MPDSDRKLTRFDLDLAQKTFSFRNCVSVKITWTLFIKQFMLVAARSHLFILASADATAARPFFVTSRALYWTCAAFFCYLVLLHRTCAAFLEQPPMARPSTWRTVTSSFQQYTQRLHQRHDTAFVGPMRSPHGLDDTSCYLHPPSFATIITTPCGRNWSLHCPSSFRAPIGACIFSSLA